MLLGYVTETRDSPRLPIDIFALHLMGFVLLVLGLLHALYLGPNGQTPYRTFLYYLTIFGFPMVLIGIVTWLHSHQFNDPEQWRTVVWVIGGLAVLLTLTSLHIMDVGYSQAQATTMLLSSANLGAILGVVGGFREVQLSQRIAEITSLETANQLQQDHNETLDFVSKMLRHHLLNAMNIVLGRVELMEERVTTEQTQDLRIIHMQAMRSVGMIENFQELIRGLSGDVSVCPIDMSSLLDKELDTIDYWFPEVSINRKLESGIRVLGYDGLERTINELLVNAAKHNDNPSPTMEVSITKSGEDATIRIEDNGPGMCDETKQAYFKSGKHGKDSLGEGIGLYLAETAVNTLDGTICIEDREPTGTRVNMELPLAN